MKMTGRGDKVHVNEKGDADIHAPFAVQLEDELVPSCSWQLWVMYYTAIVISQLSASTESV
jgi:hypothetical protein